MQRLGKTSAVFGTPSTVGGTVGNSEDSPVTPSWRGADLILKRQYNGSHCSWHWWDLLFTLDKLSKPGIQPQAKRMNMKTLGAQPQEKRM